MEQHMLILKPLSAWKRQAEDALTLIECKNGGKLPARFIDGDSVDHRAFASLVEALVALEPYTGRVVGQDLIDAAGLKSVDEVI